MHWDERKALEKNSGPGKPVPVDAAERVEEFVPGIAALTPALSAFSMRLCGNRDDAADLVQTVLCNAWRSRHDFRPGTDLRAWLFTIMRNQFYTEWRRCRRQQPLRDAVAEGIPTPPDQQFWTLQLAQTLRSLRALPQSYRDALILVAVAGFQYAEAAILCHTAEGTVKSRVARGRELLRCGVQQPRRTRGEDATSETRHIQRELARILRQCKSPRLEPAGQPSRMRSRMPRPARGAAAAEAA